MCDGAPRAQQAIAGNKLARGAAHVGGALGIGLIIVGEGVARSPRALVRSRQVSLLRRLLDGS